MSSIETAFLSSLTSLYAQQAQINTISQNVANSSVAGYSSQNVPLSSIADDGGVATGTVTRASNAALAAAANQASSAQAYSGQMTSVLGAYSATLTQADATSSDSASETTSNVLSSAMTGLQSALTALTASPGEGTTQGAAVAAAGTLASTFHALSAAVGTAQTTAGSDIAADVTQVNSDLTALSANEQSIQKAKALGQSTAQLEDTRDGLVADIATRLPVQVLSNANGISLTTDGGTTLFDGTTHLLQYNPSSSGAASVTVAGDPPVSAFASTSAANGGALPQNGSIAANLQLLNTTLPGFANQLDQLAGNVVTAFQKADPSVASGQAGLFTVNGAAISGTTPTAGLANAIAVNQNVLDNPALIQAGAGASGAGQSGDTSTVIAYLGAMSGAAPTGYGAATGVSATASMTDAATQVAGLQQSTYSTWSSRNDSRTAQTQAAQSALSNSTGVNVDEQMQRLLLIQQTYAASSQVIQAAAQLLSTINSVASTAIG